MFRNYYIRKKCKIETDNEKDEEEMICLRMVLSTHR